MFRLVRVRRTGDFGWGVIVENGGSQLVSFHEARKDADRAARKIAGALKYRLAIDGES